MLPRELRAEIYRVLSEAFKEPSPEFAEMLGTGELFQFLTNSFGKLGLAFEFGGTEGYRSLHLQDLKRLHWDAFHNPVASKVTPVESVYRRWSEDPASDSPLAKLKGYLMSDRALHVQELYRRAGLTSPPEFSAAPDHLALELEFMALLCERATFETQAEFCADHLDWVDDLAGDAAKKGIPAFYRGMIEATAAFVLWDAEMLAKTVANQRPQAAEPN